MQSDYQNGRRGLSILVWGLGLFLSGVLWCGAVWAMADETEAMEKLLDVGFEELANMTLTTASRKQQRVVDTSSAVYVLDQEDIRRSGMPSLPELLRLVPGLQVARIDNAAWAITARGFNAQYSNKLLILMDGRTLYSPLFNGVFWNAQDVMLETIDRIEVVRGPGGSLWGANAVNGVINIITKKAADTQGGHLTAATGNVNPYQASVRYGGRIGNHTTFRLHAKGVDRRGFDLSDGRAAGDGWDHRQGGFRADIDLPSSSSAVTVQGDLYHTGFENTSSVSRGGNLLARWEHALANEEDLTVQFYYDRVERTGMERRDTFDLDFQHRFAPTDDHEMIWGLSYRLMLDEMVDSSSVHWSPSSARDETFGLFVQDEVSWWDDRLKLVLGTKIERNDDTGLEYQPNARLLWHPDDQQTVWVSASRAISSPSRSDRGFNLSVANGFVQIKGQPEVDSEILYAYEAGYRVQSSDRLFIDVATFYNRYDQLVSYEETATIPGATRIVFDNKVKAAAYGVETAVDWRVRPRWKIRASHTWLKIKTKRVDNSTDREISLADGDIPRHQFQLRSYLDLSDRWQLDSSLFYVDDIERKRIPSYVRWDLRLGWSPVENMTVSLSGHNLLDRSHPEYLGSSGTQSEIPRCFQAQIDWSF